MPLVRDDEIPVPHSSFHGQYPYRYTQDDRFQYRVKVQPAGDCLEFVVRPVDTRRCQQAEQRAMLGLSRSGPRSEPSSEDREDSIRRSTERAKRGVRLLAIHMRVDRLLTFTTRGTYDLGTLKVIWDRFVRLYRTVDSSFVYVAVPETHKDGAHWHIHAAIHGWVNVSLLRRMWQASILSVTGRSIDSDCSGSRSPGNVDISYKGRAQGLEKSRRIASYIAKYVTKTLVADFNKKRYWQTKGIKLPDATKKWLESQDLDSAIREVMEGWGLLVDGQYPVRKVWKPGGLAFFWVDVNSLPVPPF